MIKISLAVEGVEDGLQLERYKEIFAVLIEKGALDGVRGGSAIIHFDAQGVFQGVQLDYWPWRRRKNLTGQTVEV